MKITTIKERNNWAIKNFPRSFKLISNRYTPLFAKEEMRKEKTLTHRSSKFALRFVYFSFAGEAEGPIWMCNLFTWKVFFQVELIRRAQQRRLSG